MTKLLHGHYQLHLQLLFYWYDCHGCRILFYSVFLWCIYLDLFLLLLPLLFTSVSRQSFCPCVVQLQINNSFIVHDVGTVTCDPMFTEHLKGSRLSFLVLNFNVFSYLQAKKVQNYFRIRNVKSNAKDQFWISKWREKHLTKGFSDTQPTNQFRYKLQ